MPPCPTCRGLFARLYPLPAPSGEPPTAVCRRCYRATTGEPPDAAVIRWALAPVAPTSATPTTIPSAEGDEG